MSTDRTPGDIVRAFSADWLHADPDRLAAYFTDDAVYHNIPMEPVVGREAITEFLRGFVAQFGGIDFEILRQVESDDLVFNERIDRFSANGVEIALPVTGVFELSDGRIRAWRDYFDLAPVTAAFGG